MIGKKYQERIFSLLFSCEFQGQLIGFIIIDRSSAYFNPITVRKKRCPSKGLTIFRFPRQFAFVKKIKRRLTSQNRFPSYSSVNFYYHN
jgi:hypothetical protein